MNFNKWLDTFIEEKGFDLEYQFEIQTEKNLHLVDLGYVIETIKTFPVEMKQQVKNTIVRLDFANNNKEIMNYFRGFAVCISKMWDDGIKVKNG